MLTQGKRQIIFYYYKKKIAFPLNGPWKWSQRPSRTPNHTLITTVLEEWAKRILIQKTINHRGEQKSSTSEHL